MQNTEQRNTSDGAQDFKLIGSKPLPEGIPLITLETRDATEARIEQLNRALKPHEDQHAELLRGGINYLAQAGALAEKIMKKLGGNSRAELKKRLANGEILENAEQALRLYGIGIMFQTDSGLVMTVSGTHPDASETSVVSCKSALGKAVIKAAQDYERTTSKQYAGELITTVEDKKAVSDNYRFTVKVHTVAA